MTPKTVFNNLAEFAAYHGIEETTEESLSHWVYKNTDCGAWLKIISSEIVTTPQRWIALLRPDNNKVFVDSAKPLKSIKDINNHRDWLSPDTLPEEVKEFLCMQEDTSIESLTWEQLTKIVIDTPEMSLKQTQLQFKVPIKTTIPKEGIQVGSIVEGSDADCEPFTLYFPFSEQTFDTCLESLEDEAAMLWHECNDYLDED